MKIDIEDIEHVLREENLQPEVIRSIKSKLKEIADQEALEKEKEKDSSEKLEYRPVLIAIGDSPALSKVLDETPFFVVEIADGIRHTELQDVMKKVVEEHNAEAHSKRKFGGKKSIVNSVPDFIETMKPKTLKPAGFRIKIKEQLLGVAFSNSALSERAGAAPDAAHRVLVQRASMAQARVD